jgi:hypothetical protein
MNYIYGYVMKDEYCGEHIHLFDANGETLKIVYNNPFKTHIRASTSIDEYDESKIRLFLSQLIDEMFPDEHTDVILINGFEMQIKANTESYKEMRRSYNV